MSKNLSRRLFFSAASAALALLPAMSQPVNAAAESGGGTLFGIAGSGQSVLSTIDPATGVVTTIEDLAGPEQGQLVSVTGDPIAHRIYALRESTIFIPPTTILVHNQVLTINSDNGAYTTSPLGNVGPGQIVFDTSTGSLYQLGMSGVSTIDPATGKTTPVASFSSVGASILSMAVVPGANTIYVGQTLFAFDTGQYSYEVVTINTVTGATSPSPIKPGRLGFIMYDPSAGVLLAFDNQNLYSVDPASGVESVISNYNTNPQALSFFAGAVDPSTNTVYLQLQVFDFFNPIDQVVAINDLSGNFTPSGNITTNQLESMYFQPQVTVTSDSIANDVRGALVSGQITKAGVANSLLTELAAAAAAGNRGQCKTAANIYQQFINDVRAQTGKSIGVATASRLSREAEFLQGNCP
jgi:hypothetical protein